MARIKIANDFVRKGEINLAIKEYEAVAREFPRLRDVCEFNLKLLKRKPEKIAKIISINLTTQSNKKFDQDINNDIPLRIVPSNSQANTLRNSKLFFSNHEVLWSEWKSEFGPGTINLIDDGATVSIESDGSRFYLSKKFIFKNGKQYTIKIKIKEYHGKLGDYISIVNEIKIQGDKKLNYKSIPKDGNVLFRIKSEHDQEVSLRLGLGTTTAITGSAKISISGLEIIEEDIEDDNSKNLGNFAKQYIDPQLSLPELSGLVNDYTFIELEKKKLLESEIKWERKKVSIIIPCFERFDLLRKTIAALSVQDYPSHLIELIIVDDGSRSHAIEKIFDEFAKKINLYFARQAHNGYGLTRARNLGARSATGDVLFFLDSDIILPRVFIRELMSFHHISNDVSVLGIRSFVDATDVSAEDIMTLKVLPENIKKCKSSNPHLQNFNLVGENVDWRIFDFKKNNNLKQSTNPFRYFGGGHASVTREKFFAIGGYDENFSLWGNEDQEFAYRLWSVGQYFIPMMNHRDYHQEEFDKKQDQSYKLEENKITHQLLIDKCPHFSVRELNKNNEFSTPLFSIYIPAYNVEPYIEECIDSALAQSYKDFEIVVVDDGSTDFTLKKVKEKYECNKKVRIYSKENGGIGSASNFAITQCVGEYIVQLDSDDKLFQDALEKLANYFSKNPSVECVYTKHKLIDDQGILIGDGWSPSEFDRYENLVGMSVPHLRAYRRSLFHKTVGFDETLLNAVDYDFFLKLSEHANIHFLDDFLYFYRVHKTQTSSAYKVEQQKNHEVAVNRHLERLGLCDFYAKSINPFEPQRNFLFKKGSDFEALMLDKVFEQPKIEGFELPEPKAPGNDYSLMQSFVKEYYKNNPNDYTEKISIVVPVYNRAERLSRCLAGIYHQTYPKNLIEVVVVDDGSSDDVLKVIDKYNRLLDLKYIKQHDDGYRLSAARNLGIRSASHRNISIIDCDLIPLPIFIESFMQYLHHFDNVVLLGHQRFVDPTGISGDDILKNVESLKKFKDIKSENSTMEDTPDGITRDWRYKLYEETNYLKNDEYPYRAFSSGHVAYRKKVIEDAGYYDEDFNVWGCEDNEAGYRIYQKGYYFIPVLEAVDLHQEPPSGKNETNREADRLISRELLQSKLPAMRGWFGNPYEYKVGDIPLVSVCIPVHNTGHFAKLAVDSALKQTMQDFEVLIYDDASNDGTLEMLKSEYGKNPKVRIIEGKSHKNVTFARNLLIDSAKGEFVGFLDSDDLLKPECLKSCISAFRGSADVGLISTEYEKIDEDGNFISDGWSPSNYDRQGLMFGNVFTHFRMFRVRDWSRSRKWTNSEIAKYKYGEDWDLCLKLAEVSNFARVNETSYQYRIRSTSITNNSNIDFKLNQTLLIANSWMKYLNFNLKAFAISEQNSHQIGFMSL